MSNRPVSRDIYWRRRLLVLAGLIALVWLGFQIAGLFGGDDKKPAAQSAPTATASSAAAPTTEPPADQLMVSLDLSDQACKPQNLRITPSVAAGQFSGSPVKVEFMVSSLDSEPCTFQPSADELLVVVDASRAPIYDSSVCRAAFFDQAVQVPAGWSVVTTATWSGRGSGKACRPSEGFAPPGSYTLKVGTYGGEPGEVKFKLDRRPAVKTTTTATTAPTTKPSTAATKATATAGQD